MRSASNRPSGSTTAAHMQQAKSSNNPRRSNPLSACNSCGEPVCCGTMPQVLARRMVLAHHRHLKPHSSPASCRNCSCCLQPMHNCCCAAAAAADSLFRKAPAQLSVRWPNPPLQQAIDALNSAPYCKHTQLGDQPRLCAKSLAEGLCSGPMPKCGRIVQCDTWHSKKPAETNRPTSLLQSALPPPPPPLGGGNTRMLYTPLETSCVRLKAPAAACGHAGTTLRCCHAIAGTR
jgi:hypothetical protein